MRLGWRLFPDPLAESGGVPDWQGARPRAIESALHVALERPGGGWYVLDAARRIGRRPRPFRVAGRDLVAWRDDAGVVVAPEECPHMGASLACGHVDAGRVVCPWHGLALGREPHGAWRPLPAWDDGVLAWVRLDGEPETEAPVHGPRPQEFIDGVIRVEARCEPRDVLANRLDPWHGAHYHPYSFASLELIEENEERLVVRVQKRVLGPLRVAVEASFECPDPRTIVMHILDGEGAGSVVETHATPIEPGRTAVIEATLATSPRPGFRHAQRVARLVRPFVERSARRLWVDDAAYAERLFELRTRAGDLSPASAVADDGGLLSPALRESSPSTPPKRPASR